MADQGVSGCGLANDGLFDSAAVLGVGAIGAETAAAGWVDRRRELAGHLPLLLSRHPGIRDGDGSQQPVGVEVHRGFVEPGDTPLLIG
jgi:hypothetical protein